MAHGPSKTEPKKTERPHAKRHKAAQDFYQAWEAKGFPVYFEYEGFRILDVPECVERDWRDPRDFD